MKMRQMPPTRNPLAIPPALPGNNTKVYEPSKRALLGTAALAIPPALPGNTTLFRREVRGWGEWGDSGGKEIARNPCSRFRRKMLCWVGQCDSESASPAGKHHTFQEGDGGPLLSEEGTTYKVAKTFT